MDPGGIGSFLSVVAIVAGIVVAAHPATRFSRIFSIAFGPVARVGELRSGYLLRFRRKGVPRIFCTWVFCRHCVVENGRYLETDSDEHDVT